MLEGQLHILVVKVVGCGDVNGLNIITDNELAVVGIGRFHAELLGEFLSLARCCGGNSTELRPVHMARTEGKFPCDTPPPMIPHLILFDMAAPYEK